MKKYVLLFVGILAFQLNYGQDYIPLLGDSNEWYYSYIIEGTVTEQFYTSGDTVLFGKDYKAFYGEDKIFRVMKVLAYLREDTVNRKVYALYKKDEEFQEEVLLYDFSLQIDDSIQGFHFDIDVEQTGYSDWLFVDSVNKVDISGVLSNTLYLSSRENGRQGSWIEGIGSLGSPRCNYMCRNGDEGELVCCFKDGEKVFESNLAIFFDTCMIFTQIEFEQSEDVRVFPNPGNFLIVFDLSDMCFSVMEFNIYDFRGALIYETILDEKSRFNLNVEQFAPGIYMYRIRDFQSEEMIEGKFIVN